MTNTNPPDAVRGSTVKWTTMADGTLRLTVDIEPYMARSAIDLFGTEPGASVAVARLEEG